MRREQFIKTIVTGAIGMKPLSAFRSFTSGLNEQEHVMPALRREKGYNNTCCDNELPTRIK